MQTTRVSYAEFERFVTLPENSDSLFELIDGEIIQVSPGTTGNSEIGQIFTVEIHIFCRANHLPCHTTSGDGAYRIGDHVVAPDFAFKTARTNRKYPDPVPPLLVVEIISKNDKVLDIRNKRNVYIDAGILVWEVYPDTQSIDIYAPGQPHRTVGIDDMIDGGDVLPGFTLPVRALFPDQDG